MAPVRSSSEDAAVNAQYLYLDANFVKAEIAKLIEAYPDLADDEMLRADMIEAETDAKKIVERALSESLEAEAMAEAVGLRQRHLAERAGRYLRKSEAMRKLIKSVMRAAGQDKMLLTEATISLTKARASVGIHSLEDLPQGYFKTVTTRQADKAAIKSALEKGDDIPGAFLVLGEAGLTVRTK